MTDMQPSRAEPSGGDRPAGRVWRETLERLTAWLEAQGLEPDRARELGESAVIVCALRQPACSAQDALDRAILQAHAMR